MTIRKGQEWAKPATRALVDSAIVVGGDAHLAAEAMRAWEANETLVASPGEGDVLKTLGLEQARTGADAMVYQWDLGLVEAHVDGAVQRIPFVSHVFVRHPFWVGRLICVMNTPWYGRYRLGPKAHPNDGLLDITDGSLPWQQLLLARRRALSGSHLPHPALKTSRAPKWDMSFDRNMNVSIDRAKLRSVERVEISLIPDVFSIVA